MAEYQAESLASIAAHFRRNAASARTRAAHVITKRDQLALLAEARTWLEAASMLEATTLVPREEPQP